MSFVQFIKNESGAVTVDWVVLTASIVGLGLATTAVVSGGVENLSTDVATHLTDTDIASIHDWSNGTGWGDLAIFSPHQSREGAESYAASVLDGHNGDYQAAYEQLYQQAVDMTYADGESIDDLGAFEALADANNVEIDRGENLTYAEFHAQYAEANGL